MIRPFTTLLCVISILVLPTVATAQSAVKAVQKADGEHGFDQVKDGELGYTMGCSFAASLGIVVCGELPSGKQADKDQNSADASAAIATVQKMQADAGGASTASSQAIENLQQQDSQDSADTSAAVAAFQKVKQAADNVVATTPDVFTITQPYTQESSPNEKVPAWTFPQRLMAWGVEAIPGQETQNTPPAVSSADESAGDDAASSEEDIQADDQAETNPFAAAQQQLQQNMQELNDLELQQAAQNRIPSRAQVQQSQGPQFKRPQNNNCSGSNAIALCSVH